MIDEDAGRMDAGTDQRALGLSEGLDACFFEGREQGLQIHGFLTIAKGG
jgi:hypothetical protein